MKPRSLILIGGAVCFILIFTLTGAWQSLAAVVRVSTQPVMGWTASVALRLRNATGRSAASEAQLQELEKHIASEALDRTRLFALEEENRTLKAQLRFLQDSGYEAIGARVISRDLQNGRMHFLLDRGTRDGLEVGQAVITANGIFVGKILRAAEVTALLEVFTDPEARTVVARASGGRAIGVIEGRGNGAALLVYIPPSEVLQKNDLIVTAGTEEKVPAHLPIGIINQVNGKSTDPFLTAAVESLVGLDRLSFVSVLRPHK